MRWRIAKHAKGFVCIIYEDSHRRRIALKAPNKWLAQAEASDLVADIERRRPKEILTVSQIIDAYIVQTEAITKQEMVYRSRPLKEALGGLKPDDITEAVCKNFAAERKRSPGTIRVELGLMNTAFKWAKKHKLIAEASWVWMPPAPPPRDRRLTRAEANQLRRAVATVPHLRIFTEIALNTAGRASALLGLKWAQVDLQRRRIDLGGTGRQKRRAMVPINDTLFSILMEAHRAALTPWVIEYAGRPLKSIEHGFNAAVRRAGLDRKVTPHVLRHTAASWMEEDGISMPEIAAFLGHTDSRITERVYARLSPDHLHKAAKVLG